MKKFHILVLFVSILMGCSRISTKIEVISIKENLKPEVSINELFGEVTYITIDSSEPSSAPLIGMITKVLLHDNKIYLSDIKNIYVFDLNGSYITMISRYGRGGNEYIGITDFTIYENQILVLDQNKKVLKYTLDGKCIQSLILDFYPASITIIDNDRLLLTSAYQSAGDKFHIYDVNSLEKVNSFHPIEENQVTWRHFRNQTNFYRYNGKLIFHEPMNNTLYHLKDSQFTPLLRLDLFNRNAPDAFWQKQFDNVMDINIEASDHNYCFGIPSYCENDDNLWFTYRDGNNYRLCLYSKINKNAIQSSNISIPELSVSAPVSDLIFSLESKEEQMIVLTGDMLEEDVKINVLHIPSDYDNPIFIINRSMK